MLGVLNLPNYLEIWFFFKNISPVFVTHWPSKPNPVRNDSLHKQLYDLKINVSLSKILTWSFYMLWSNVVHLFENGEAR